MNSSGDKFAKLANLDSKDLKKGFSSKMEQALNIIAEECHIDYGQVTLFIHQGKVSPSIEIQKRFFKNIKDI